MASNLTPQQLFDYARTYAKKAERRGRGTQYPTFTQAARHFKVPVSAVEQACEDWQGKGYMAPAVGLAVNGAYAALPKGQWQIEAYGEDLAQAA